MSYDGEWSRQWRPSVKVAHIEGGKVQWEGKEAVTTDLTATAEGFETAGADGTVFRARLDADMLVWDDSEVWVRVQAEPQEVGALQQAGAGDDSDEEAETSPLLGDWELLASGFRIKVGIIAGALCYDNKKAQRLRPEGAWFVADCGSFSVRMRSGPSGRSLTYQQRVAGAEDWSPRLHGARPSGVAAGTELLTTAVTKVRRSVEDLNQFGTVPPGTRVIAGGAICVSSYGVRSIPLQPRGAVDASYVRLLELVSEADDDEAGAFADPRTLLGALDGGDTVLLRGAWLRRRAAEPDAALPRRQKLPPEALWSPAELRPLVLGRRVQVVAVSYCWITAEHPDPEGLQLRTLGGAVDARLTDAVCPVEDLAIFLDWCSLHQRPRRPDQEACFGRALEAASLWYAHADTMVLTMTKLPGGCRSYDQRGWPFFDRAVSSMLKDSSRLLDLGKPESSTTDWLTLAGTCMQGRRPPLTPSAFELEIQKRTFTNKADDSLVIEKYAKTYTEVLGQATVLDFAGLGWGKQEAAVLADVLPDCHSLRRLVLQKNPLRADGIAAIAQRLPQCQSLKELDLDFTSMGDGGAAALADVLPRCEPLRSLRLQNTGITGEGVEHLAAILPSCPRLEVLLLGENTIGQRGAKALLAAIPACRSGALRQLTLLRTGLDEAEKEQLRAAWKAAGKRAPLLNL